MMSELQARAITEASIVDVRRALYDLGVGDDEVDLHLRWIYEYVAMGFTPLAAAELTATSRAYFGNDDYVVQFGHRLVQLADHHPRPYKAGRSRGRWRIRAMFEPRDLWVGVFWDRRRDGLHVYVTVLPTLVLHLHHVPARRS